MPKSRCAAVRHLLEHGTVVRDLLKGDTTTDRQGDGLFDGSLRQSLGEDAGQWWPVRPGALGLHVVSRSALRTSGGRGRRCTSTSLDHFDQHEFLVLACCHPLLQGVCGGTDLAKRVGHLDLQVAKQFDARRVVFDRCGHTARLESSQCAFAERDGLLQQDRVTCALELSQRHGLNFLPHRTVAEGVGFRASTLALPLVGFLPWPRGLARLPGSMSGLELGMLLLVRHLSGLKLLLFLRLLDLVLRLLLGETLQPQEG
mmetsp:Transcript_77098/g.249564  ORF Transcript_77098/g.249564 Transcript_77098/m.249564 type:complete len:258 (+) Transcript_77098:425-1198(+)